MKFRNSRHCPLIAGKIETESQNSAAGLLFSPISNPKPLNSKHCPLIAGKIEILSLDTPKLTPYPVPLELTP